MLLFCDSFQYYLETHLERKWNAKVEGVNRIIDLSTAYGHLGRNGVRSFTIFGETCYLQKNLSTSPSTVILGGWLRGQGGSAADGTSFWAVDDGVTNQVNVRSRSDGQIIVRRGTTVLGRSDPGVIGSVNQPHHFVEAKIVIHDTNGSVEIRIDEVPVLVLSGVDTQSTANAFVTAFRYGNIADTGSVGGTFDLTEFYLCDDSGSNNNDFLGICGVRALFPNGAGVSADYTPSTGSNFQCVDEATPNDDTDHVQSSVSGDRDLYDMGATGSSGGSVYAIAINTMDRLTNTSSRMARHLLHMSGGVVMSGDVYAPGTSYANRQTIFEGSFTVAETDVMQCGFEVAFG